MSLSTEIAPFNVASIRQDFPVLNQEVHGQSLVYLDNGASSQKPKAVVDAISHYYLNDHSNVHRGVHHLSQRATGQFEAARVKLQNYIGAEHEYEVIFTKGTTDSINLVAFSYGMAFLKPGDEIIVSELEHHSNIVPWQMACERHGAVLKVIPIADDGSLDMETFRSLLNERTKMVAVNHVSNALGTINPVEEIIALAHQAGAHVLLDGAQSLQHDRVDVKTLDVDFYASSAHKMFGPTGIGFLYGKEDLLNAMPPYQGGGDMIETVTFEKTTYNTLPHKFEAGTPNIADVIGFGAAVDYLNELDWTGIHEYEAKLLAYATEQLTEIPGLKIIGTAPQKAPVISFLVGDQHPYDTGMILDHTGVAVRTGHHCTEPLMNRLGIPGTVRASMAFYNTFEDIDRLVAGIMKAKSMLD